MVKRARVEVEDEDIEQFCETQEPFEPVNVDDDISCGEASGVAGSADAIVEAPAAESGGYMVTACSQGLQPMTFAEYMVAVLAMLEQVTQLHTIATAWQLQLNRADRAAFARAVADWCESCGVLMSKLSEVLELQDEKPEITDWRSTYGAWFNRCFNAKKHWDSLHVFDCLAETQIIDAD